MRFKTYFDDIFALFSPVTNQNFQPREHRRPTWWSARLLQRTMILVDFITWLYCFIPAHSRLNHKFIFCLCHNNYYTYLSPLAIKDSSSTTTCQGRHRGSISTNVCDFLNPFGAAFQVLRRGVETHGCSWPFRLQTAIQIARKQPRTSPGALAHLPPVQGLTFAVQVRSQIPV